MINAKVLAQAVQVLENPRRVPWHRAAGLLDKDIGCVRHLSMGVKSCERGARLMSCCSQHNLSANKCSYLCLQSTVHEYTGSHCREIVDMDVHMRVIIIANQGKSGSVKAFFRHVKLFEV